MASHTETRVKIYDILQGTLIRQLQQKATSAYHIRIVRGCVQWHTVAKDMIYYGGHWADRYKKRRHPHTTEESCEAISSNEKNKSKKMMCYEEHWSDSYNKEHEHEHTTKDSCGAVSSHTKKYDMLRGAPIRQIQQETTLTYHKRNVRGYVQSLEIRGQHQKRTWVTARGRIYIQDSLARLDDCQTQTTV